MPKNDQNWHFWSIWARSCRLIQCPVGGSVGGCGARAVSRKTPIYFISYFLSSYLEYFIPPLFLIIISSQFTSYGIALTTIIVMRAIQGLFPIIPFSYILSLLFYPSLVSYSYFWMIDFLCKVCSWKPVYRTTILTLMTPWKSAKYNSSEQAEVEATVNQ